MKLTNKDYIEKYSKAIMPYLKNTKNQNYLTIILTIGASIFFFLFAINPTISTISKLQKEIEDNKLLDQKMSQKINNLSSLTTSYAEIEDDIPFLKDAVPQNPSTTDLIGQIQTLASQANLTIGVVEISPVNLTSLNPKINSFNLSITASGQFNDTSRFINDLISMQRALTITSTQITRSNGSDHSVIVNIKAVAYFKK